MGLLAWLPIENRTAFPGLLNLLWHLRCWLQNYNIRESKNIPANFVRPPPKLFLLRTAMIPELKAFPVREAWIRDPLTVTQVWDNIGRNVTMQRNLSQWCSLSALRRIWRKKWEAKAEYLLLFLSYFCSFSTVITLAL